VPESRNLRPPNRSRGPGNPHQRCQKPLSNKSKPKTSTDPQKIRRLPAYFNKFLEQSAAEKAVAGAPGKLDDKILLLVGHDTNIATVAGSLGLDWIIDGRRDDTPPGGALVFELWRAASGGDDRVRVFYTAQSLDQMRTEQPLTLEHPPLIAPLFVPACGRADLSCSLAGFASAVREAINPALVRGSPN
jgi:4-phytase / acid phosphatase